MTSSPVVALQLSLSWPPGIPSARAAQWRMGPPRRLESLTTGPVSQLSLFLQGAPRERAGPFQQARPRQTLGGHSDTGLGGPQG